MPAPRLPILNETIRILHFHVPMWFGMIIMFAFSVFYALKYLSTKNLKYDLYSEQLVNIGVMFGILGIISGMVWANFTWGVPWSNDPKQNASAISLLIYFALIILRGSLQNDHQRAFIRASIIFCNIVIFIKNISFKTFWKYFVFFKNFNEIII